MTFDFDADLRAAANAAARLSADIARPVAVLRDISGRCSLLVDDRSAALESKLEGSEPEAMLASEFYGPELLLDRPNARELAVGGYPSVQVVEQQATGDGWTALPISDETRDAGNSVALYSFKGGVGRTTATTLLAWQLARRGHKVLVVDLDLESPGVGEMLLPSDRQPGLGVVDLLLGASFEHLPEIVDGAVARSPISDAGGVSADVFVCPAGGASEQYEYLPRLNRAYAPLPTIDGPVLFEHRVVAALDALRAFTQPDVMLIDSRAGLHDLSAVAVTQYCELALLFATDTPQTWAGYRSLFSWWAAHPTVARQVRQRLKLVAGVVPAVSSADYLEAIHEHAYDVFRVLYDEVGADDGGEPFHPTAPGSDTPHDPIAIPFAELLRGFDPFRDGAWRTDALIEGATESLTDTVLELLGIDERR